MGAPPAFIFVVRHGNRLDAEDKEWHLTTPTPYDPPLTEDGRRNSEALGARMASILRARQIPDDSSTNSTRSNNEHSNIANTRRRRLQIVIHTSPFLRCLETSIGISAGLAQSPSHGQHESSLSTPSGKSKTYHSAQGTSSASPQPVAASEPSTQTELAGSDYGELNNKKPILRVDAFLGEWLTPDYFELITPPPGSIMMVSSAKAALISKQSFLSISVNDIASANTKRERTLSDLPRTPNLPRTPVKVLSQSERSSNPNLGSSIGTTLKSVQVPLSYVYHAGDDFFTVDFNWDSMREPWNWGDGGEYGEEWRPMHKRFRQGLQKLVQFYSNVEDPAALASPLGVSAENEADSTYGYGKEDDVDLVVIMVTHGAGCVALIEALTNQPVLLDVGMTSLTMAVRKQNPGNTPSVISDDYEVKLVANTEHLRSVKNRTLQSTQDRHSALPLPRIFPFPKPLDAKLRSGRSLEDLQRSSMKPPDDFYNSQEIPSTDTTGLWSVRNPGDNIKSGNDLVVLSVDDGAREVEFSKSHQTLPAVENQEVGNRFLPQISNLTSNKERQGRQEQAEELEAEVAEKNLKIQSDADSDKTTEISDMESVYSIWASTLSSKTSIHDEVGRFAAEEFVTLLLEDGELKRLCSEAIRSDRVGAVRFERNFRRLLNQYSADLKAEAKSDEEKAAVYLIRSRARFMAKEIRRKVGPVTEDDGRYNSLKKRSDRKLDSLKAVEQYLRESNKPDGNLRQPPILEGDGRQSKDLDTDVDSEENSSEDGAAEFQDYEGLPKLSMVKDFMINSTAFVTFLQNLRQFIYQDFKSKLGRLLSKLSKPESSHPVSESSLSKLRILVAELECVPPHQIRIIYQDRSTLNNRIKGIIEDFTKEAWDWWPLKPRIRTLLPGQARVYWHCTCGEERWEEVPEQFAKGVAGIPRQIPTSSNTDNSYDSQRLAQSTTESSTTGQSEMPSSVLGSQTASPSHPNPADNPSFVPIASSRVKVNATMNMQERAEAYVLFGVSAGEDLHLAQIEVQDLKDDQFFGRLKGNYNHLRGFFRQWFSIWKYSHCEFVKFEKFDDNDIIPRGEGIPAPGNRDYQYKPSPAEHMPPISAHEFRRRFYACRGRCSVGKSALLRAFHRCKRPCRHSLQALDRIPKKKWRLEESGGAREFFWGIHGVERLAFHMVATYHALILLPPFVFWFLWLFLWGHQGDLQNASVPFLSALGVISLFWFPLFNK